MLRSALESAPGNVKFKDNMIMVKKIIWLIIPPQLFNAARIPEAAPLCSGGTEHIMEVIFGEEKIPNPAPITNDMTAKDK